ncbi:SDR family oxidoreductase [Prosthecomicrobium pneumaticum]|uniref:NAD(P)-dependent dehydrogenase (Short-subunit alcohol dehydrogenase family) n=1 Tax=Prosthecomicrobium pneumaticum TaxID=81895 RepID=A0A7W9CUD9_9HYPH|nr:SDR family oxidoreductase [Prosthecomicrobium pneumaticum]MBB5751824.1 NAD(P)-dependent dehydrogenase (short-subunit alcohol dehydrogenase family) [Prosthecomicrobium pneumaticum]
MSKTAIVTAASKGIGAAAARRLAADGYTVGVLGRSEGTEAIAAEIGGFAVRGDVTSAADLESLVAAAREKTGRIDAVVVSVGHAAKGTLTGLTDGDWHAALDMILMPTVRLARLTGADLAATGGAFVAVSSYAALRPDPVFVVSSALRAALTNYVRMLAREWAKDGVSVNAVAPGFVDSLPEKPERLAAIPAGRYARVEEIAATIAHLVSPEARYLTGQTIAVDGGLVA